MEAKYLFDAEFGFIEPTKTPTHTEHWIGMPQTKSFVFSSERRDMRVSGREFAMGCRAWPIGAT